ncbi:11179_t:CDS:2 [Ambispora gerdemannii]|uniref:11179_t:CDS:1 n=1 Tax=Ambispora gerdemannii TaxID=144530 RepID=A0A9N9D8T9_9GLOM|nr:11179_t:CDS:2 [Ambispora gerdemannii]
MSDVNSRCILAIGKTGNGKSFTGTIFGARDAEIGNDTKSKTEKVTFHNIGNGSFYVDTPGFDDSNEDKGDDETVHSIFRTMVNKKIRNITTILWFVMTDVRATASFKRQARFIESLAQFHDCNVWNNTIIVTKGNQIDQGPREAAKEIANEIYQKKYGQPVDSKEDLLAKTGDLKILLFESLEDNSIYVEGKFTSAKLNSYGVFKGSEPKQILAKYEALMKEHNKYPIPFIFKRVKCLKCPEETDPRIAVPKCHKEAELIHGNKKDVHLGKIIQKHTKDLAYYHPDSTESYHPSSKEWVHTGKPCGGETKQVMDNSAGAWTLRVVTIGNQTTLVAYRDLDAVKPRLPPDANLDIIAVSNLSKVKDVKIFMRNANMKLEKSLVLLFVRTAGKNGVRMDVKRFAHVVKRSELKVKGVSRRRMTGYLFV